MLSWDTAPSRAAWPLVDTAQPVVIPSEQRGAVEVPVAWNALGSESVQVRVLLPAQMPHGVVCSRVS